MHYEEHSALVKEGHLLGFANLESFTSVYSMLSSQYDQPENQNPSEECKIQETWSYPSSAINPAPAPLFANALLHRCLVVAFFWGRGVLLIL